MNHPLQCRCGTVRGQVQRTEAAARGVCYCKHCQAYAHWLGQPADVLDGAGGTDLVALQPSQVTFSQGRDRLQCVSLTDKVKSTFPRSSPPRTLTTAASEANEVPGKYTAP